MRRSGWILASFFVALPILALACPTCKDALGDNPESRGFANGIYYTIVLLLGMLFSIVGFIIYKIVQEARRPATTGPDAGQAPSAQ
jgi:Na+-driven multidrug efflux pump